MAYCPQSLDVFLEHMMMMGLEKLGQALAGKVEEPKEQNLVVTPAETMRGPGGAVSLVALRCSPPSSRVDRTAKRDLV